MSSETITAPISKWGTGVLSDARRGQVKEAIRNLEKQDSISALLDLLKTDC